MDAQNPYIKVNGTLNEAKLYRDADFIASGACNPQAVARTLYLMIAAVAANGGHPVVNAHPAIRVVLDHLCVIILGSNHPAPYDDYASVTARVAAMKETVNVLNVNLMPYGKPDLED